MKTVSILLVFSFFLVSCTEDPQLPLSSALIIEKPLPEIVSFLEQYIPKQMEQELIPGLSLAIIRKGKIVWTKSFGVSNLFAGKPTNGKTVYEAASLGKPIAAYGILRLVVDGEIQTDSKLFERLSKPFLPESKLAREITLGNVLSHTSGLSNDMRGFDQEIYFSPGERFQYSGVGYLYMQAVLEDISNISFNSYVQNSIFKPLDMKSSTYKWDGNISEHVSLGHLTNANLMLLFTVIFLVTWIVGTAIVFAYLYCKKTKFSIKVALKKSIAILIVGTIGFASLSYNIVLPLPIDWSQNDQVNSASSLYSTPDDIAKFMLALMDPDDSTGVNELMLKKVVEIDRNLFWGNGIGIQESDEGRFSFWQWGSNIDFQGFMIGYPREQIGIVILTNSSNGLSIIPGIVHHAIGGDLFWLKMI